MQRERPELADDPASVLDTRALALYLTTRIPGFGPELRAQKFAGGQSNPTYKLESNGQHFVLRKKPAGTLLPTAHMVDREYRVFRALADSDVPVPRPLVFCDDTAVIGTEFFVMEYVAGRIFWNPTLPSLPRAERSAIYAEQARVLAALHTLDVAARGLSDYGKPGNYFARQIKRWTGQYEAARTETIASMDALATWLPAHIPSDGDPVSLVHGDFRLDNMIFHPTEPRVLALLDWELSTLGHPLADLAYACLPYHLGGLEWPALREVAGDASGIPLESEYVAQYCRRAGRELVSPQVHAFCLAFSLFRYASIVQGVYRRGLDGNASSRDAVTYRDRVVQAADVAWDIARGQQASL